MHIKLISALAAFALLSGPAFAVTNLVENGAFHVTTGWWGVNDGVEHLQSNVYGLSCQNVTCNNLEVLANHSPDSVYQDVSGLVIGHAYELSYLFGGRVGDNASMITSFGGANIAGSAISGHLGSWVEESFRVIATATTERLEFTATALTSCGSCGAEVANVSLTAVPELSTWTMMLAGFGALGFAGYRRNKALSVTA
jgi:hypothetical protein